MIDHEEPDAEVRARLTAELEKRVELARARARALTLASMSLGSLALLAVLVFGALVLRDKTESEHTNGQRISALTAELADARTQLADTAAVDREIERCAKRFDGVVSSALSEYLASLGDLIVSIGTLSSVPAEQRAASVDAAIADVDSSLNAYQASIDDRSAWQQRPQPLPCPLVP